MSKSDIFYRSLYVNLHIFIYTPSAIMAPRITPQSHVLYDFLGSHHKLQLLQEWVKCCVRAMELKIDYGAFRQMRKEKVIAKRLGKAYTVFPIFR